LLNVIFGNFHSPKFLVRALVVFPKAVWMAREMQLNDVAHVHAHYATHPALAAWVIHQISGIPYSITVHAHDIFVDKSMLERKTRDARKIVAISQYNRTYLINQLGPWIEGKIEVIHCGVVPHIYAVDSRNKIGSDQYNILSIGSLRPYKGFQYLLDACDILKQKGFSFCCRIVGAGELHSSLQEQIDRQGLRDSVQLLGPKTQAEVADLLRTADCYVQPSVITSTGKMEGIPVSLMEALASELPAIATNISGVPELVRPGQTGYLVPPEDPQGLAEAILHVGSNPEEARTFARSGRQHVVSEFNIVTNVAILSQLFESFFED
jgi:glycosyltransferase involved in cell wall biosynthesis